MYTADSRNIHSVDEVASFSHIHLSKVYASASKAVTCCKLVCDGLALFYPYLFAIMYCHI